VTTANRSRSPFLPHCISSSILIFARRAPRWPEHARAHPMDAKILGVSFITQCYMYGLRWTNPRMHRPKRVPSILGEGANVEEDVFQSS